VRKVGKKSRRRGAGARRWSTCGVWRRARRPAMRPLPTCRTGLFPSPERGVRDFETFLPKLVPNLGCHELY